MNTSSETNTISEKIKKLLALADGNRNQNEHERDAAMKLAMELLSKHNLDLSTITNESNALEIIEVDIVLKLEPWLRCVLHAVCKLYYTDWFMRPEIKGYYYDRKEWHPTFVGTRENITVTLEVASWLIHSIKMESNWRFNEQFERRSFRLGAANKLFERARQLIDEEKTVRSHSTGNSLMVLRNKLETANKDYKDRLGLGQFQARGSSYSREAYGMGESFGDSVNFGRQTKLKAITMTQ